MSQKQCLYDALRRRNGRVRDQAEWRELGQSCGYSAHGDLAGFFGARRPSTVAWSMGRGC